MPTRFHPTDQLPAYALGALDPEEAAQVEAHLMVCETCRAELRAYEEIVGDMALAVPQEASPPGLKRRILADIMAEPEPAQTPPSPSWWQRVLVALRPPNHAFAAVAAVLLLILLTSNLILLSRLRTLERQAAMIPPLPVVALYGSDKAPQARAVLILSEDGQHGALVVDDLPPLDENHAYQLWLITPDGKRDSGAVFRVDENGYVTLMVENPKPLKEYAAFGVTIEPASGSPQPTGPNVLKGQNLTG